MLWQLFLDMTGVRFMHVYGRRSARPLHCCPTCEGVLDQVYGRASRSKAVPLHCAFAFVVCELSASDSVDASWVVGSLFSRNWRLHGSECRRIFMWRFDQPIGCENLSGQCGGPIYTLQG